MSSGTSDKTSRHGSAAGSILHEIAPKEKARVLDLVKAAGVDVSDWKNFAGGERGAAGNPKYCYEWAFIEHGRVVVLNLWFASMRIEGGRIVQRINMRKTGAQPGTVPKQAVWSKRARKMDDAIKIAYEDRLPVRVVVCDGRMRQSAAPDADASRVTKRLLDPVTWSVSSYDESTGDCILVRGAFPARFVDQFAIQGIVTSESPTSRPVSSQPESLTATQECGSAYWSVLPGNVNYVIRMDLSCPMAQSILKLTMSFLFRKTERIGRRMS